MRSWLSFGQRFKKRHICDTHAGVSFFFECLKRPQCCVDWKTETSSCEHCGAFLRPPELLLLYNHFGCGWQGWFALFLGDIWSSKLGLLVPRNAILMITCYIMAGHLIPAILATLGVWESLSISGLSQGEVLDAQRSSIERRNKSLYQQIVRTVLILIFLLLGGYALALRK